MSKVEKSQPKYRVKQPVEKILFDSGTMVVRFEDEVADQPVFGEDFISDWEEAFGEGSLDEVMWLINRANELARIDE